MLVTDPGTLPASIPSLCNNVLPFPMHSVAQIATSSLKLMYSNSAKEFAARSDGNEKGGVYASICEQ